MATFLLIFFVFALMASLMAVGVMFGKKPIAGSCGGIANLGIEKADCPICGGNPTKCDN
jgi:hypothetical protein